MCKTNNKSEPAGPSHAPPSFPPIHNRTGKSAGARSSLEATRSIRCARNRTLSRVCCNKVVNQIQSARPGGARRSSKQRDRQRGRRALPRTLLPSGRAGNRVIVGCVSHFALHRSISRTRPGQGLGLVVACVVGPAISPVVVPRSFLGPGLGSLVCQRCRLVRVRSAAAAGGFCGWMAQTPAPAALQTMPPHVGDVGAGVQVPIYCGHVDGAGSCRTA